MKERLARAPVVSKLIFGMMLSIAANCATAQNVEVKFPEQNLAVHQEGTYASIPNLRNVGPGLTKYQIYDLLGTPHFHEGLFDVKIWNYIFNFHQNGEVVTCQYQVQFDKDNLVRAAYWKEPACADYLKPEVAVAPVVAPVVIAPGKVQHYNLSADALFGFGRSDLDGMQSVGRKQLDELGDKIKENNDDLRKIVVTGHTDRIGSEASNMRLSLARAATVRDYLATHGIDRIRVEVQGVGASQPVANCPPGNSAEVIACLQPDRRVTLDVSTE